MHPPNPLACILFIVGVSDCRRYSAYPPQNATIGVYSSAVLRSGSHQGAAAPAPAPVVPGWVVDILAKVLICAPEPSTATKFDRRHHRELRCYGHDLPAHVLRAASSHGIRMGTQGTEPRSFLTLLAPMATAIVRGSCPWDGEHVSEVPQRPCWSACTYEVHQHP